MNPNQYKVSRERYEAFLKDYAWQVLKNADYRLGQAFINYFNEVDQMMSADGDLGKQDAVMLYYTTDHKQAQEMINRWISD